MKTGKTRAHAPHCLSVRGQERETEDPPWRGKAEEKRNQPQSGQNKRDSGPSMGGQEEQGTMGRGRAGGTGKLSWGDRGPSLEGAVTPVILPSSSVFPALLPPWRVPCSSALYPPWTVPCPPCPITSLEGPYPTCPIPFMEGPLTPVLPSPWRVSSTPCPAPFM